MNRNYQSAPFPSEQTSTGYKRGFSEFSDRMLQLDFRELRVHSIFTFCKAFHPFKALFLFKRVKRIMLKIHAQKEAECKKGYWM